MWRLLRIALLAFTAYAVVTASPAQRMAMLEGVQALAGALQGACLRASPCRDAVQSVGSLIGSIRPEPHLASELPRRERPAPLLER